MSESTYFQYVVLRLCKEQRTQSVYNYIHFCDLFIRCAQYKSGIILN